MFGRTMVFPPKIVSMVDEEGIGVRISTLTQSTMGGEQPDKEHHPPLPQQRNPHRNPSEEVQNPRSPGQSPQLAL